MTTATNTLSPGHQIIVRGGLHVHSSRLPATKAERRDNTERRQYTWRSLVGAVTHPRRTAGRRREDRRFPVLDRFDSGVTTLAILIMCLSVLDSLFTLTLLSHGGSEVNPFMNYLLQHSVWLFTAVKMLLTAVPVILLVATGNLLIRGRVRPRSLLGVFAGLYAGLIVYELMLLNFAL